jgi:hypothetical protein
MRISPTSSVAPGVNRRTRTVAFQCTPTTAVGTVVASADGTAMTGASPPRAATSARRTDQPQARV